MSAKYLLPCHDGNTVEVTTADAGRTIACPCGKKVTVPTLRGVQNLPRAAELEAKPTSPPWSARQGAMFTIGLCVLLGGLTALGMRYNDWRKINTDKPEIDPQLLANVQLTVDNFDAAETLDAWHSLRSNAPPEERRMMPWEANRQISQRYLIYMSIAGAIAAIGLGLTIAGPLLRPTAIAGRPHRKPAARVAQ